MAWCHQKARRVSTEELAFERTFNIFFLKLTLLRHYPQLSESSARPLQRMYAQSERDQKNHRQKSLFQDKFFRHQPDAVKSLTAQRRHQPERVGQLHHCTVQMPKSSSKVGNRDEDQGFYSQKLQKHVDVRLSADLRQTQSNRTSTRARRIQDQIRRQQAKVGDLLEEIVTPWHII